MTNTAAPARSGDILGLDLTRFAAACAVTIYHLAYHMWSRAESSSGMALRADLQPIHDVSRWGWVGVQIFFVLSGFLIAYTTASRTVGSFVRSRVLRLYPTAWICAGLTFVISYSAAAGALPIFLNSLILWPFGPWVSGVYWTLGVEIVFYVVVAFAVWRAVNVLQVGYGLITWSALYYVARVVDTLSGGTWAGTFRLLDGQAGNLTLLRLGCYFGVGVLLWSIKFGGLTKTKTVWLLLAVMCCALELLVAGRFFVETRGGSPVEIAVPLFLWCAGMGVIVLSLRYVAAVNSKLHRWGPQVRTAGLMTYPLYLVHSEIGRDIMLITQPVIGSWPSLALAFAAMLLLAWLIVRYESVLTGPLARVLHNRTNRRLPAAELP